jgi:hypothetical protein
LEYRLLLRNNLERTVTYGARLLVPVGWDTSTEFRTLRLEAGGHGELNFKVQSPRTADPMRRLITAEIQIDGQSQGPISEALVTVRD